MRLKSIKIKSLFQCNKSDRIVNMELKKKIIYMGIKTYAEIIGIVAIVERYIENTVYDSI